MGARTYRLFGHNYRDATLYTLYPTVSEIIIAILKDKGPQTCLN